MSLDSVQRAIDLIHDVYGWSCVGGNAHIVVDDGNMDTDSIRWCLGEALIKNVHEAPPEQIEVERQCLEYLLTLTEEERHRARLQYHGIFEEESE